MNIERNIKSVHNIAMQKTDMRRRYMDSLSVVLSKLKLKDQGHEVIILAGGRVLLNGKTYKQKDLVIQRTYRFEGESDPGDAAIVYVVRAKDGIIGYCLDGYGMYCSHTSDLYSDFIKNARIMAEG